jgi:hypothetical protein
MKFGQSRWPTCRQTYLKRTLRRSFCKAQALTDLLLCHADRDATSSLDAGVARCDSLDTAAAEHDLEKLVRVGDGAVLAAVILASSFGH